MTNHVEYNKLHSLDKRYLNLTMLNIVVNHYLVEFNLVLYDNMHFIHDVISCHLSLSHTFQLYLIFNYKPRLLNSKFMKDTIEISDVDFYFRFVLRFKTLTAIAFKRMHNQ